MKDIFVKVILPLLVAVALSAGVFALAFAFSPSKEQIYKNKIEYLKTYKTDELLNELKSRKDKATEDLKKINK